MKILRSKIDHNYSLFIIHFSSFIIHFMIFAGRGELRSPAGDHRSPLQVRMLIFKNIKFCSFLRVAEGVDPYN